MTMLALGRQQLRAPQRGASRRPQKAVAWPWLRAAAQLLAGLTLGVGLLAGGVWGWSLVTDPATLPVHQIEVTGDLQRIEPAAVREAAQSLLRQHNFLTLRVDSVRQAVEAQPWVDHASVERVWPNGLRITVSEESALAQWAAGGLVNVHGERFQPVSASYPQELPVLSGPADSVMTVTRAYRRMSAMVASVDRRIIRLQLDARRAWHLRLDTGMQVILGRGEIYPRLRRFVQVYDDVLAGRATEAQRVDVRYTNGLAVRWQTDAG